MEILLICIVAFLASLLTFYSGFGLGTLLLPVFSVFYGVQTAVFLTALVHFLNNSFKAVLVWKQANKQLALKFALFAIPAGLAGANLLGILDESEGLYHYTIGEMGYVIDPIQLTVGLLMVIFGVLELSKKFGALQIDLKWLPLGGILSGFFDARIRKNNAVSPGLPEPGFLGEAGAGFFVRLRLLLLLFC